MTVVAVLGMHRSGTSALARGVHALGVSFGSRLMAAVPGQNARGFWEDVDVVEIDERVLIALGRNWHSLSPITEREWRLPGLEDIASDAGRLLAQRLAQTPLWGFKDPRATRLLPFWQRQFSELGADDAYVIALRNPVSIAQSLAVRNGFSVEKSYLLWLEHMVAAMRYTAGRRRMVVDYDALLASPERELRRVARFLGIAFTDAIADDVREYATGFLTEALCHSAYSSDALAGDPRACTHMRQAYGLLCEMARRDPGSPNSDAAELFRALDEAMQGFAPVLDYLDDCDRLLDERVPADVPLVSPPEGASTVEVFWPVLTSEPAQERVSVVIPLYNHADYIEEAINSVILQSVQPFEVIVVDDGSTDQSAERVRRLCEKHPRIIFWSHPNQGAHYTLNAALHRAAGDFVAILNSDDYYHPDRLAACLQELRAHPDACAVFSGVAFVGERGQPLANQWYDDAMAYFREVQDMPFALVRANFLVSSSNLFVRRAIFQEVGYFAPLRYAHDLEFLVRLLDAGKRVRYLDRALLNYRVHGSNTISESAVRVDVEVSAVHAHSLYRRWQSARAPAVLLKEIERYATALTDKGVAYLVEYFMSCLDRRGSNEWSVILPPPGNDIVQYLTRLGISCALRPGRGALLDELSSARLRLMYRRVAPEADRVIAGLKAWIRNLETAKQWLAEQNERQELALTDQREWAQKLEADKKWLAEQNERLELALADQRERAQKLEGETAWLSEQNQRIGSASAELGLELDLVRQNHAEFVARVRANWIARLANRLSGGRLLGN